MAVTVLALSGSLYLLFYLRRVDNTASNIFNGPNSIDVITHDKSRLRHFWESGPPCIAVKGAL